ncbi:MAG TPA: serine/threonine-protein kinase, partial [Polyangiaceae bacterium]|nr:serine/threonine-protein kinase [Polyangiaceae bacterium]
KGGSGLIFQALDTTNGQPVALKTLNADLLSHPSAVTRYHREAKAAGSIGHPNICTVSDVGQLPDGRPFLVMELLTGRSLADCIRDDGALPFSQVLNILTQTLSALEAAHEKKIVHRDIKPDNVFLTDRIQGITAVKLLDFGIAKSLDENAELSLTRTGMVVGTPFYMAPEQARGEKLDHRVDLYACGVLLYEMLTGHRPYHATNYNALMVQVLSSPPPDPRHIRPAIPAGFAAAVQRAMAKDRRERYPNARSFLAALWELRAAIAEGPRPEEVERIAQAIQSPAHRPFESNDSLEIPVFHEAEPQPPISLGMVENIDSETVTQPFVRPEQLRFKRPASRSSFSDVTEVMMDAPWLEHHPPSEPPAPLSSSSQVAPSSWDDEPTRVDNELPSTPKSGTASTTPKPQPSKVPRPAIRAPRPKPKS